MHTPPLYSLTNDMKLIKYSSFLFFAIFLFASCSDKRQKAAPEYSVLPPSIDILTNDDTLAVLQLANNYISAFAAKDYHASADMLYKYEGDSVRPLNNEERASYIKLMRRYPNYGCKLKGVTLRSITNNRVFYHMQVISNGNLDKGEGVMKFMLNPVMKDGEWYLTLFDPNAEGTKDLYNHE